MRLGKPCRKNIKRDIGIFPAHAVGEKDRTS